MLKQLQGARLGVFVFLGTVLIFISIFLVGNKDSLFVSTLTYKTYFSSIEGLRTGASVRLSGMDVGSVTEIQFTSDNSNKIEVTLKINESVKDFIRLDTKASLETEGLVGAKIISLQPGTPAYERVKEGGVISSIDPINLSEIFRESEGTVKNVKVMTENFSEIVAHIAKGEGTIGKMIYDEELYNSSVAITKSAKRSLNVMTSKLDELSQVIVKLGQDMNSIVSNVDSATSSVKMVLNEIEEGKGSLGSLIKKNDMYDSVMVMMSNLVRTTDEASKGAKGFADNMEALKHNWLFKGYFESNGYWEKTEEEKEFDRKLGELNRKQQELDLKIKTLRELEEKLGKNLKN